MLHTPQLSRSKRRFPGLKWTAAGIAGAVLTLVLAVQPTGSVNAGDQVSSGRQLYQDSCLKCHGAQMQGNGGTPRLAGAGSAIRRDYTTAKDLHDFIARAMPFDSPGSLKPQEYWDLVAFLWNANGVDPGNMQVGPDTAARLTWDYTPAAAPAATPVDAGQTGQSPVALFGGLGAIIVVAGVLLLTVMRKRNKAVR